jgi:hypothetical protein
MNTTTKLQLGDVGLTAFSLAAELEDGGVMVRVKGTGDMDAAPMLAKYLPRLQMEAQRLEVAAIRFDLRELYFMNSSCLKAFVAMIVSSARLAAAKRYRVVFYTEPRLPWQKRSLEALRNLGGGLVSIEPEV